MPGTRILLRDSSTFHRARKTSTLLLTLCASLTLFQGDLRAVPILLAVWVCGRVFDSLNPAGISLARESSDSWVLADGTDSPGALFRVRSVGTAAGSLWLECSPVLPDNENGRCSRLTQVLSAVGIHRRTARVRRWLLVGADALEEGEYRMLRREMRVRTP